MYLERLLQINMATLAALGALLLGMGERSEAPPLLVVAAAAASVWLTDITGTFYLGRRVANLLMLVAAAISLVNIFPLQNELQTLGFAWLVICLQIILLFQRKDERTYWLLVMLSLLQVVVATLFSQGVLFGALLVLYMLLGFSAMTLLLFHRQWQGYRAKEAALPAKVAATRSVFQRWLNPAPQGANLAAVAVAAPMTVRPPRWPLAGQMPEFVGSAGGSGHAGVCRDLYRRLGRMGLATLALAMALFFAVPRFGQLSWRGSIARPQPLVGFSDKVALGELGRIIESRDEVMRVQFIDASGKDPLPGHGPIYLQGAVLMDYDRGQWQTGSPSTDVGTQPFQPDRAAPRTGVVRQKTIVEGLDRDELFFVAPYIALQPDIDILVDYARQRLLRQPYRRQRRFDYVLGTTAIVDGMQKPLTPSLWSDSIRNARALPSESLPNLVRLARQWIDQSGLPEDDRAGRARYLERQLSGSGQFRYSLTGQERNPAIDPIEDFVTEHPQGHCEYFATALTLMLRSQNIPARMIVGFKCDEWNAAGGYYQVRQLHAHTWVEAFLRHNQIPEALKHGGNYWNWDEQGGWLRLDPTPGAVSHEDAGWFSPLRRALDRLDFAWSNYVVELDCERQRNAIYQPIGRALRAVWRELTNADRWRAMYDALLAALHLGQLSGAAAWLTVAVAGILVAAMLSGTGWLLWRLVRRLRARWAGNHAGRPRGRRTEIEFYRRLESLLARQGLLRAVGQTQREFAEAAGLRLALAAGEPRLAGLPGVVADAFYRVRFGRQPLDNLAVQAVEHALAELATLPTDNVK